MMCPNCKIEMGRKRGDYQYRECGLDNIWLKAWEMFVCPTCDMRLAMLPDAASAARVITSMLVRQEATLNGDAILFLRKALGLKATALATILGVHRVEVSRWENNKTEIDPHNDFKLRLEAIDRLVPQSQQRGMREDVTLIFQRAYCRESGEDHQIYVPVDLLVAQEHELAMMN